MEVSESHSVLLPVLTGVSQACGDLSLPTATAGSEDAPRLFLLAMVLTRLATQGQLPGGGESCAFFLKFFTVVASVYPFQDCLWTLELNRFEFEFQVHFLHIMLTWAIILPL